MICKINLVKIINIIAFVVIRINMYDYNLLINKHYKYKYFNTLYHVNLISVPFYLLTVVNAILLLLWWEGSII